jgi:hypothetical protein
MALRGFHACGTWHFVNNINTLIAAVRVVFLGLSERGNARRAESMECLFTVYLNVASLGSVDSD